jgi:hypothetical protein
MKDISLDFHLRKDEARGVFVVQLVDRTSKVEDDFSYDFANKRLSRVLDGIENNHCSLDDLKEIGINLWTGLMAGKVGERFETIRQEIEGQIQSGADFGGVRFQFRLSLPPELEVLPWEALYHERDFAFLACHPDHSVLRSPSTRITAPPPPPPVDGKLKILAVIPAGSGLDAEHEWHNLEVAVGSLRDRIHLERLSGRVDSDRLGDQLRAEHWDIVHFIGHGEQAESGKTLIRLNSSEPGEDERWMEGEKFASLFVGSRVSLAVLNCCLGAKPSALRSLSGLGPFLLRAGVPGVVAMRYEIPDGIAIRFSDKFYQELLNGRVPGRVDLAVEHARRSIYQTEDEDAARAFVTPILFLAPGCEQLFRLEREIPTQPVVLAEPAPVLLPEELVDALRQGLCIPVIGQRVLTGGATRSSPQVMEPRQLARTLAQKFSYPRPQDLDLCEMAGDWMDLTILQCICQHHVARTRGASYKLTQEVQNAYKASRPPALLGQIAEWDVPGVFYLYFDGLLEEAFEEHKKPVRVVNAMDAPVPPGSEPLLVHVRGTHKRADSLVLTEQDHDRLWDRIGRMTPEIGELIRGHIGRSLLFLGVNPRDPLVKRLISKLLEQASRNTLGPVFFICRPGEKDDSYWEEFPVVWIEGDLETLATAMTQAIRREV